MRNYKPPTNRDYGRWHGLAEWLAKRFVKLRASGIRDVERTTTTATNNTGTAMTVKRTTTQDMADGFGVALGGRIEDSAGVANLIGTIEFVRDGADNSGLMRFNVLNAGSWYRSLALLKDGSVWLGGHSAADYAEFKADGELNLHGTARVWRTLELSPTVVKLPGANPPAEDTIDSYPFHRYDRGTIESIHHIWHVPHDYAATTASVRGDFKFVVENPPVSPAGDEAVVMGFAYTRIAEGSVFAASETSGTITETIAADETAKIIHITDLGYCSTSGWAKGDTVLFRFYRDATNVNDTYDNEAVAADNDVWVFDYHLEYLADKLGEAS